MKENYFLLVCQKVVIYLLNYENDSFWGREITLILELMAKILKSTYNSLLAYIFYLNSIYT